VEDEKTIYYQDLKIPFPAMPKINTVSTPPSYFSKQFIFTASLAVSPYLLYPGKHYENNVERDNFIRKMCCRACQVIVCSAARK